MDQQFCESSKQSLDKNYKFLQNLIKKLALKKQNLKDFGHTIYPNKDQYIRKENLINSQFEKLLKLTKKFKKQYDKFNLYCKKNNK